MFNSETVWSFLDPRVFICSGNRIVVTRPIFFFLISHLKKKVSIRCPCSQRCGVLLVRWLSLLVFMLWTWKQCNILGVWGEGGGVGVVKSNQVGCCTTTPYTTMSIKGWRILWYDVNYEFCRICFHLSRFFSDVQFLLTAWKPLIMYLF